MNPHVHMLSLEQHVLEHQLRSTEHRRLARAGEAPPPDPVTLRLETVADADAIAQLATLAGRARRGVWGRHVIAEIDGEIVAALPLSGGSVLADPFRRTAHLVPLLQLRARQVTDPLPEPRRRRLLRWSRA